ncbi:FAD-binding oxidoreductase [Georgenia alba]|uniref:FAD-binding oxidoreductase n=1 Tax=Georgenia alba TaxID=2233858 RepID=A0ABW2Q2Q9_9MICO
MTTLDHLDTLLGERLLRPGTDSFTTATRLEFAGLDDDRRVPSAVAQVTGPDDVAAALRAARESGAPVAVRTGGHSYARHPALAGAVVIDTRRMDGVEIDAERRLGWAQGGVLARAYTDAAFAHGLATGFGDTPTVGVAGLTLGGGIGFLSRRDGLTIDNLLSAEVVLADGSVVTADADQHPDLFWALRGGGGNFGVVTKLGLRLTPTTMVTGGMLVFDPTPALVAGLLTALLAAPDELSAMVNVMRTPPMPFLPAEMHGRPGLLVLPCWSGPAEDAERAFAPIRALGEPVVDTVGEQPYPALLEGPPGSDQPVFPDVRTGFVDAVDEEWAAAAIDVVATAPTPMAVVNLRVMGGAIARVSTDATAFAHRDRGIMASVGAMFFDPTLAPAAQEWTASAARRLTTGTAGYVNFMTGAAASDVEAAYPGETLERLREVKRTYDPENVFRAVHNVHPA